MSSTTTSVSTSVSLPGLRPGFDFRAFVTRLGTGLILVPAILIFLLHGFLLKLVIRDSQRRRERLVQNVARYSSFALKCLRVEVQTSGSQIQNENALLVCNHMSYLDLLVIASVRPAVFVTSIDMGEVFFLGTMAEIGGSLFIERRHRERVGYDVEQMAKVLRSGQDVILFPEGTSSDGASVLPFRKSLLMAAPLARKKLLPMTLKYVEIDGQPFGPENHQSVCWYGKMSFLPHFSQLLGHRKIRASLQFHLAISPREGDDKDVLAKWCYRLIAGSYSKQDPNERSVLI